MSDLEGLPGRARAGASAVGGLAKAFDDLSKSGKVSHQTIVGLIGVLPALSSPVGALALGIAGAATALGRWTEEAAKAADESAGLTSAMDRYYEAIISGATESEALLRKQEAERHEQFARRRAELEKENSLWNRVVEGMAATADPTGLIRRGVKMVGDAYEEHLAESAARAKKELDELAATLGRESRFAKALSETGNTINEFFIEDMQEGLGTTARMLALVTGDEREEALHATGQGMLFIAGAIASIRDEAVTTEQVMFSLARTMEFEVGRAFGTAGVGIFDAYADAMERSISITSLFSEETGRAMQNALAASLRALGQSAAAHAAEELAYAAMTAINPTAAALYGPAPAHLAAAGMWASVAALAGVASPALSVGGGGGRDRGRLPGADTGRGDERGPTFQLILLGNPDAATKDELARWIQDAQDGRDV